MLAYFQGKGDRVHARRITAAHRRCCPCFRVRPQAGMCA